MLSGHIDAGGRHTQDRDAREYPPRLPRPLSWSPEPRLSIPGNGEGGSERLLFFLDALKTLEVAILIDHVLGVDADRPGVMPEKSPDVDGPWEVIEGARLDRFEIATLNSGRFGDLGEGDALLLPRRPQHTTELFHHPTPAFAGCGR